MLLNLSTSSFSSVEEQCCQQVKEGDPSHLFGTGESIPGVLFSALGSPLEEIHGHTGVNQAKGH